MVTFAAREAARQSLAGEDENDQECGETYQHTVCKLYANHCPVKGYTVKRLVLSACAASAYSRTSGL